MRRGNIDVVRQTRAKELDDLARLLNGKPQCPDAYPLFAAAQQCREHRHPSLLHYTPSADEWCYEVKDLIFRLESVPNSVPKGVNSVSLELSVKICAKATDLWEEPIPNNHIVDPFTWLEFNMVLRGFRDIEGKIPVFCSWHLDRHILESSDGQPDYMHPLYHIHLGGSKLWDTVGAGYDYGCSLVLESPRFAHPPMDAILGVDFVLTNYFPLTSLSIRQDNQYCNLVETAQARIWRPYAQALAHAWTPVPNTHNWQQNALWPQLIPAQASVLPVPTPRRRVR